MLGEASPPVTRSTGWSSQSKAALDLVGEPATVGGAERALFGDEHAVGLAYAGADGVPVQ